VINARGAGCNQAQLRGVNSTICSGLASGLYAIDYAAEFLRLGRAKYLLAGGMEEVCEEAAAHSSGWDWHRLPGYRSFQLTGMKNGCGEGSALWLLESEETATAREQDRS